MSKCRGYNECSKVLNKILENSKHRLNVATQDTLAKEVFSISTELVDFTSSSEPVDFANWNEIEQIEQLDTLADATRQSLVADSIERSVNVIMDSTSKLNQLVKKLKSETEQNNKKEKDIRLKKVVAVVDSLTSLVDELKDAKASLSTDSEEVDIAKKVDGLIKAFQNLEKAIQDTKG
jgi:hypothetical protein